MFDLDTFIEDCRACLDEPEPRLAVRETVSRAVSDASAVAAARPTDEAGLTLLYRSDDLTIVDLVWAPGMEIFPHDHRMWACIGIYTGREDNRFYRRPSPADSGGGGGLVESGGKRLETSEVTLLGSDTIHAVHNPLSAPTGALHVYGGDFVAQERSQWLPPELVEQPYDTDRVTRLFADADAAWHRAS